MEDDFDPEGTRLPIKIDSTSNGEWAPVPLTRAAELGNREAFADAQRLSRKLNISRRQFLISAAGAAATLLAFNRAHAQSGARGGFRAASSAETRVVDGEDDRREDASEPARYRPAYYQHRGRCDRGG